MAKPKKPKKNNAVIKALKSKAFEGVTLADLIDYYFQIHEGDHLTNLTPIKRQYMVAYEKSAGNVSSACKAVGISRFTFYEWYKEDEHFTAAVDYFKESIIDFAESKLLQNIRAGDNTAILFFLKCRAKDRGYIEKSEIEVKGNIGVYDALKGVPEEVLVKAAGYVPLELRMCPRCKEEVKQITMKGEKV